MQKGFITFMSISLLMITTAQAASSSKALVELPKFKKEADIPNKTLWKCAAAGFLAGTTQQAATFVSIPHLMSPENTGIALFGQWLLCFGLSAVCTSACAGNVNHLTAHNTECASMIFNKITPLGINPNPQEIKTRDSRLKNFINEYKVGGNHTAEVCKAYNDLLESNIKWRSFWGGYWFASALGPIPSFAAVHTLMKLGKLPC